MFDVGLGEAVLLAVLALVIFGDQLPKVAAQAGRALRQLRQMATAAKADLQSGLGPEFADLDIADLHPRRFVRKHLLEDDDDVVIASPPSPAPVGDSLPPGERPPFDVEAT